MKRQSTAREWALSMTNQCVRLRDSVCWRREHHDAGHAAKPGADASHTGRRRDLHGVVHSQDVLSLPRMLNVECQTAQPVPPMRRPASIGRTEFRCVLPGSAYLK